MLRDASLIDVEAEVRGLEALGTAALRQRWQALTGAEPAPGLKGELLRAVLARRLQEQALGGWRRDMVEHLASLAKANPAISAEACCAEPPVAAKGRSLRPLRRLRPGSRLLRDWQGRMHEVIVTPEGYVWSGETHASLSTIAKRITGTSWNGWRFFGVAPRSARKSEGAAHG